MFIVLGCMLAGILIGILLRKKKIRFVQQLIITLIWLLLFFLGLEIGSNKDVISQFGKLGLEAFLIATAGTLGSVVMAKLLWNVIEKKKGNSTND
ncbi:MAG: lysine exporter LysO family protein [Bacteroidales bacterium]|nr:lysine exporter LysO family protein [Bacteroidales bacterium]